MRILFIHTDIVSIITLSCNVWLIWPDFEIKIKETDMQKKKKKVVEFLKYNIALFRAIQLSLLWYEKKCCTSFL